MCVGWWDPSVGKKACDEINSVSPRSQACEIANECRLASKPYSMCAAPGHPTVPPPFPNYLFKQIV